MQDRKAPEWAVGSSLPLIEESEFLEKWLLSGKIRGSENRAILNRSLKV